MPPLALTGERTLPDVPEENYWFARHLVVYRWIAAQTGGLRVVDMACGEGYGSDVLARAGAAAVVGVDANPEAHEHARLRYTAGNLRFVRTMVETYDEPCDAVVFLQTIEHVQDPGAVLARFREFVGPRRDRLRLDAQRADARAARRRSAPATRGTSTSTAPRSSPRCAARTSARSRCTASFTHASSRCTPPRSGSAGTTCTSASASRSASMTASYRDRRARLRPARGSARDLRGALDLVAVLRA